MEYILQYTIVNRNIKEPTGCIYGIYPWYDVMHMRSRSSHQKSTENEGYVDK